MPKQITGTGTSSGPGASGGAVVSHGEKNPVRLCSVQKPDLKPHAGADLSATQLVELTLLDSVGQFRCLK